MRLRLIYRRPLQVEPESLQVDPETLEPLQVVEFGPRHATRGKGPHTYVLSTHVIKHPKASCRSSGAEGLILNGLLIGGGNFNGLLIGSGNSLRVVRPAK